MRNKEIAAFAYKIKNKRVFIVLVTNRKGNRWILPKGQPEFRMSDKKVALLEAYEEAGIRGKLSKKLKRENIRLITRRKGDVKMKVYPIELKKLLGDWPESRFRKRVLISADKAIHKVRKRALRACIKNMAKKALQAEKKA